MKLTAAEMEKERAALYKYYITKNWSINAVADKLGLSVNAVYRKLAKYKIEKSYADKLAEYKRTRERKE